MHFPYLNWCYNLIFQSNTVILEGIKIKFYNFEQCSRSYSVQHPLLEMKEILPLAKKLLGGIDFSNAPIRLIGLTVSNPREEQAGRTIWKQLKFKFTD